MNVNKRFLHFNLAVYFNRIVFIFILTILLHFLPVTKNTEINIKLLSEKNCSNKGDLAVKQLKGTKSLITANVIIRKETEMSQ